MGAKLPWATPALTRHAFVGDEDSALAVAVLIIIGAAICLFGIVAGALWWVFHA